MQYNAQKVIYTINKNEKQMQSKEKYNKSIESENNKAEISTLLNTISKYYQEVALVKTLINILFRTLPVLVFIILKLYLRP